MDSNKVRREDRMARLCFLLYVILFLFGGLLLTAPPGRLPVLFVMLLLSAVPVAIGRSKARVVAGILVVLTLFLIIEEIVQGAKHQTGNRNLRKPTIELRR